MVETRSSNPWLGALVAKVKVEWIREAVLHCAIHGSLAEDVAASGPFLVPLAEASLGAVEFF